MAQVRSGSRSIAFNLRDVSLREAMASVFDWASQRGGKRQRMLAHSLAQSSRDGGVVEGAWKFGYLEAHLLEKWACKELSAVGVQEAADAARKDGFHHEGVIRLAALGSAGRHPKNCNRDLIRTYKLDSVHTPPVVEVQLPMVAPKGSRNEVVYAKTEVQHPHDMFSWLATHNPDKFSAVFGTRESVA